MTLDCQVVETRRYPQEFSAQQASYAFSEHILHTGRPFMTEVRLPKYLYTARDVGKHKQWLAAVSTEKESVCRIGNIWH